MAIAYHYPEEARPLRVIGMLPTEEPAEYRPSKRASVEGIFHAGRELKAVQFKDIYIGEGEDGPMSFNGYFPDVGKRRNAKERLKHMAAMHESPYTDPDVRALIDYYLDRAPISGNDTINTAYGFFLDLRDLALCVFPGYREEWRAVRRLRRGEPREPALLRRTEEHVLTDEELTRLKAAMERADEAEDWELLRR